MLFTDSDARHTINIQQQQEDINTKLRNIQNPIGSILNHQLATPGLFFLRGWCLVRYIRVDMSNLRKDKGEDMGKEVNDAEGERENKSNSTIPI